MELLVSSESIKEIVREAQRQFIDIAISNRAGKWSENYFVVDDIRDLNSTSGKLTILILHSQHNAECQLTDINAIAGIKFNKYLEYKGCLTDQVKIIQRTRSVKERP